MNSSTPTAAERSSALHGERVSFTGRLATLTRGQAEELVRQHGGRVSASFNRHTSILVVGADGWPLLRDGRLSNKLRLAEDRLRTPGQSTFRVCSEDQFLELVGSKCAKPGASKSLEAQQVSELVGVPVEMLRRWEFLGLVRSDDGRFDFQDLVSLKTISALVSQGALPNVIAQSVRSLSQLLPNTDRPLAQLKLLTGQDSLIAEVNGNLMLPGGQLLMRFDHETVEDESESLSALTMPLLAGVHSQHSAADWFEIACVYEDEGDLIRAEHAYRQSLAGDPQQPDAHFNLANVLRAMGRREAAEERYRAALEHMPTMTDARFNLADLLDEFGRLDEAIDCLRVAVQQSPSFADGHYNLAVLCEKAGLRDEAHEHWRQYIRLDPTSEWSAFARGRIEASD